MNRTFVFMLNPSTGRNAWFWIEADCFLSPFATERLLGASADSTPLSVNGRSL